MSDDMFGYLISWWVSCYCRTRPCTCDTTRKTDYWHKQLRWITRFCYVTIWV